MPFQTNNSINTQTVRKFDVYVPPNPKAAALPAIIVFHGGGQDIRQIEERWGLHPPNPVPALVENYLLVFPETDPTLTDQWVNYKKGDNVFPTHDLLFVEKLINTIVNTPFATGNPVTPTVTADPAHLYAAGFSSGGAAVHSLMNCPLVTRFKGFAAVGRALDPEKAEHYRKSLPPGVLPPPVPLIFIMGTADSGFTSPRTLMEVPIDTTHPYFTVKETLVRNGMWVSPNGPVATTRLIPGSTNATEVVAQLWTGGAAAFSYVTVVNGGHNWPTPTTNGNPPVADHFNATNAIIEFWHNHAGLPA